MTALFQFAPPNGLPLATGIGPDRNADGSPILTLGDFHNSLIKTDADLQMLAERPTVTPDDLQIAQQQVVMQLREETGPDIEALQQSSISRAMLPGLLADNASLIRAACPFRRLPLADDDATRGIMTGDLHVNRLGAWQARRTDPGAAVWQRLDNRVAAAPAGAITASPLAAWGIDAMVTGYTGPAFEITTTRDGTDTTTQIDIGADGRADRALIARTLAMRDTETVARVTTLYDQTGHGYHATAIVPGQGPVIGVAMVGKAIALGFNQPPNDSFAALACTTLPASCEAAMSLVFFGSLGCLNDRVASYDPLASCISLTGTTNFLFYGADRGVPALSCFDYQSGARTVWPRFADGQPDVYGFSRANTTLTLWQGGRSQPASLKETTNTSGTLTLTLGTHSQAGGGQSSPVVFTGVAFYGHSLEAAHWSALRANYALSVKGVIGSAPVRIMAMGDSRTIGYGGKANDNWPYLLPQSLDVDASVTINAVQGMTTADLITSGPLDAAQAWLAVRPPRAVTILTLFAGVNDEGRIGRDPQAIVDRLRQILQALFESGLDRAVLIAEQDRALLPAYTDLVASFGSHCCLVDPYATLLDEQAVGNGLLQPDGLHLTANGNACIAALVAPAIAGFLKAGLLAERLNVVASATPAL